MTRHLVEQVAEEPWNADLAERLAGHLAQIGQTERAALHAARALWMRHGLR